MLVKILYWVYLIVVFVPLFVTITLLTAIISAVGSLLGGVRVFSYYPGKVWSQITLALLLCPVEITGKRYLQQGRPCVVTPNHTSYLDIFMLYGYMGVPFKWVMKGSLRTIPFVGWACEKNGFIFVNNRTPAEAKKVVDSAMEAINDGYYIFIFPEGSRTYDGKLGPLRKGAFKIAQGTCSAVIPVTIRGGFEALPRTSILPTPHRLKIEVHPPIEPNKYPNDSKGISQLRAEVEETLRDSLESDF
ncbi:MAG: lysophospholipid acyltransferase family protein [Porphyromonas sp.]|nr:lysophospholipid acyltransferase family protein [Porphyromonas sp.]